MSKETDAVGKETNLTANTSSSTTTSSGTSFNLKRGDKLKGRKRINQEGGEDFVDHKIQKMTEPSPSTSKKGKGKKKNEKSNLMGTIDEIGVPVDKKMSVNLTDCFPSTRMTRSQAKMKQDPPESQPSSSKDFTQSTLGRLLAESPDNPTTSSYKKLWEPSCNQGSKMESSYTTFTTDKSRHPNNEDGDISNALLSSSSSASSDYQHEPSHHLPTAKGSLRQDRSSPPHSSNSKVSRCRRAAARMLSNSISLSRAKKNKSSQDDSSSSSSEKGPSYVGASTTIQQALDGSPSSSRHGPGPSSIAPPSPYVRGSPAPFGTSSPAPTSAMAAQATMLSFASSFNNHQQQPYSTPPSSSSAPTTNSLLSGRNNILNFLPSRMQHILAASSGSSHTRMSTLLEGLLAANDESRQLVAVTELAEIFLLGNEESLPNLPLKDMVNAIGKLLSKEENFELMLTASRCLTNMIEAVPRTLTIINDVIPYLLLKLEKIECIDVAEQCLIALEQISRRNAKHILQSNGIVSVISFIDFFSMPPQRLAFQIAANCATYLTPNEFGQVKHVLGELTNRYQREEDKRISESITSFFSRIIDNLYHHQDLLRQVVGSENQLLRAVQHLLVTQANTMSSTTFQQLIKILRQICHKCSDKAVALMVELHFADTIKYLILGSHDKANHTDTKHYVTRSQSHIYELILLMGELIPDLNHEGIFQLTPIIDKIVLPFLQAHSNGGNYVNASSLAQSMLGGGSSYMGGGSPFQYGQSFFANIQRNMRVRPMDQSGLGQVQWCFRESASAESTPLPLTHSNYIEARVNAGDSVFNYEDESEEQNLWQINLNDMMMTNIRTQEIFGLLRKMIPPPDHNISPQSSSASIQSMEVSEVDERKELLKSNPTPIYEAIQILFPILLTIGENLTAFHLRYNSIRVMNRMISSLDDSPPSAHLISRLHFTGYLTNCLSSYNVNKKDLAVTISALQMAHILLQKYPQIFTPLFKRDGVFSEIEKLAFSGECPDASMEVERAPESLEQQREEAMIAALTATNSTPLHQPAPPTRSSQSMFGQLIDQAYSSDSNSNGSPNYFGGGYPPTTHQHPFASTTFPTDFMNEVKRTSKSIVAESSSSKKTTKSGEVEDSLKDWIVAEAKYLLEKFCNVTAPGTELDEVVGKLSQISALLCSKKNDVPTGVIKSLLAIMLDNDISPFQITKAGLVQSLIEYLSSEDTHMISPKKERVKNFMSAFYDFEEEVDEIEYVQKAARASSNYNIFVAKIVGAVNQLEQFPVRTFDLVSSSSSSLQGIQAMKFFHSHQIRCTLRKHPACKKLNDWRHSNASIKVDPFTTIAAIIKYLFDRGITNPNGLEADVDSDDTDMLTDEDADERSNVGGLKAKTNSFQGLIEMVINDQPIPKDMTILQAVRVYGLNAPADESYLSSSIWTSCFTIHYRAKDLPPNEDTFSESGIKFGTPPTLLPAPNKHGESSKTTNFDKKKSKKELKLRPHDSLWLEGKVPESVNGLDLYLTGNSNIPVSDPSLQSIILLRILFGLNKFYTTLHNFHLMPITNKQLIPNSAFISKKLNAKVCRQLSDFVSITTQHFPTWLCELIKLAPFLFEFSTRRNYFYYTAFGKERAMIHMVSCSSGEDNEQQSGSKYLPSREKRKITVRRDAVLKQAYNFLNASNNMKIYMDIEFEGEVGTGYGPTLEFYSLMSAELQKHSLKLWRGNGVTRTNVAKQAENEEYTESESGLYPCVNYSNHTKTRESRIRKFEMLGRLMAQTLLDSRMLDIPFNSVFFKWLLNDTNSFTISDLEVVDSTLYSILRQLMTADAEDIDSIEQYFSLPGNDSFELIKGGKNMKVSKENAIQFVNLVTHWILKEGIQLEMEAVRAGFEVVISIDKIKIFSADELGELFGGVNPVVCDEFWVADQLKRAFKPDHGYSHESIQIKWLIEMLAGFDCENRRKFLQFVTGSPRLPSGGFRFLSPALTIVKKTQCNGTGSDQELPSAMTCYNYLKIPPYSSKEIFYSKFCEALNHIYSFHLT
uniref:E3 ubiquitin-protein ligase n=1 Tax=Rhabditophanes sp. KR3021 TaxID=114890 RepID=A0AC35TXF4_9BILA